MTHPIYYKRTHAGQRIWISATDDWKRPRVALNGTMHKTHMPILSYALRIIKDRPEYSRQGLLSFFLSIIRVRIYLYLYLYLYTIGITEGTVGRVCFLFCLLIVRMVIGNVVVGE